MDCAKNIITANFSGGKTSATTAALWQWDYGQVLCITGVEDLPQTFQMHYALQQKNGMSTTVVGADGQVNIPNGYLIPGKPIYAWLYVSDDDNGETEYAITIPVRERPMPEHYEISSAGEFDGIVEQVAEYAATATEGAERSAASAAAADASAGDAATSASGALASATAAAQSASGAAESKSAAEAAATRAEQAAASLTVDSALSDTSTNPVQNKVITDAKAEIESVAVQNIAPAYDATKTYAEGDVVSYEGKVYKCATAVDPAEAFDPGKWTKTDVVGMVSGGSSLKNIKDAEYGGIAEGLVDIETAEDYAGESLPADFVNLASGWFSHAEGGTVDWEYDEEGEPYVISLRTQATSEASHAEGCGTVASGTASHAEGLKTVAEGNDSHAEGDTTVASGSDSHAEGYHTVASGFDSHAEGVSTVASGNCSHAEGFRTVAEGDDSHAEGEFTVSHGKESHAEGLGTKANCRSQHVFGEYNVVDTSTNFAYNRGAFVEIVGNGTSSTGRSNARTLDWGGNESLAGGLTLGKGTADETTITAAQLKALIALLNA